MLFGQWFIEYFSFCAAKLSILKKLSKKRGQN